MSTREIRRLRRELDETQERLSGLENSVGTVAQVLREGVKEKLFGGEKKNPGVKASAATGAPEKVYYVDFESAEGDERTVVAHAPNKKDALAKVKTYLKKEGEELTGAAFEVEEAESV